MSDVIAALDRDHANVAKLLDLLESEILAIGVGKTPDYPLLQGLFLSITLAVLAANWLVDIVYAWLDPRTR